MPRSNLNLNNNSGFQCLLYTNFRIKKKYSVDTVAQKMGIHKDTLHKWIYGKNLFPADRIIPLTKATGDLDYLEYVCNQCDYTAMPRITDKQTAKTFAHMSRIMLAAIGFKEEKWDWKI